MAVLSLTDLMTHSLAIGRWAGIQETTHAVWYGDIKADGKKATVTVLGKMAREGVKVDSASEFGTRYNLVIEPKEETDLEAITALTDLIKEHAAGTFPDAAWTAKTNGLVYQGLLYLRLYADHEHPEQFNVKAINCKLDPADPAANSVALPKDKNVAVVLEVGYWVNLEKKMLGLVLKPQSVRAIGGGVNGAAAAAAAAGSDFVPLRSKKTKAVATQT